MHGNQDLIPDCRMRAILIVVSTPSLQLFARICKGQEPMRVQALSPKLAVEGLDEAVVGRFSGPREVQGDVVGVGPKVEVTRDELAAIIDPDRFGVASSLADTLQRLNHILTAIGETCVGGGAKARVVSTTVRMRSFLLVVSWS